MTTEPHDTMTLAKVEPSTGGFEITYDNGWSFWLKEQYEPAAPHGLTPQVGDTVWQWPRNGIGRPVRGLAINGTVLYYETEAEYDERTDREHAEADAKRKAEFEATGHIPLDQQYESLPPSFKARLDRFRAGNADFRWKFEAYELACCVDAVKIAEHFGNLDAVKSWHGLVNPWNNGIGHEEYMRVSKEIGMSDGHSGNSEAVAVRLAMEFLTDPWLPAHSHGAMVALVGCDDYGCTHPEAR